MVAAAAAAVARHLCSDDDDGDDKRAKARSPPPPSVHCGAPFFARGCCCGGGGGRSDAARSWRRRPPLAVPCSLPRSVVVLPPLQHELVAAADSLAVVLPALQHELVPAHDSLRLLADADADPCCPALPCSALLGHCPPRPASLRVAPAPRHCNSLRLARSEPRETGAYGVRRGLCCVGRAAPSRRTLAPQTGPGGIERAAGGRRERGPPCRGPITEAAGSRSLASLPACLRPVTVLPGVGRPAARQSATGTAIAGPAGQILDDPAPRPPVLSACHVPCGGACDKTEGRPGGKGKGSLLLSIRHPTLALADGRCCVELPRRRDRRPGTGGARGRKNRKKEQRVGGALLCAGPPATRGPPSAEQEPMGSTLRSRRGAGCCPSFLHSAQLTAAEPCASPCLPPLSAWATAR